jgi:syntaxin 1B/2/3
LRSLSYAPPGPPTQQVAYVQPRTQREYLDQVALIRGLLRDFDASLTDVSRLHQRLLDATDPASAAELGPTLQQIESQTLSRNDQIKRLIKNLEQDAVNTTDDTKDMKLKQISPLKKEFQSRIQKYQDLERDYRTRRQEQIRRQYLIVNPDATDTELAAVADTSGDPSTQNVFQMAVSTRDSLVD